MLIANRGKQEIKVEVPVEPTPDDKPVEPQTTTEEFKDIIDEKK